jgi:hypothetical protein
VGEIHFPASHQIYFRMAHNGQKWAVHGSICKSKTNFYISDLNKLTLCHDVRNVGNTAYIYIVASPRTLSTLISIIYITLRLKSTFSFRNVGNTVYIYIVASPRTLSTLISIIYITLRLKSTFSFRNVGNTAYVSTVFSSRAGFILIQMI